MADGLLGEKGGEKKKFVKRQGQFSAENIQQSLGIYLREVVRLDDG